MNSTISHFDFFFFTITNSLHYQFFHVEFSVEKKKFIFGFSVKQKVRPTESHYDVA